MAFFAPDSLTGAEVQATFTQTYASTLRQSNALLSNVCQLGVTSTHRQETYGYIEAAPHIELWIDTIPEEGMGSKTFTVINYKFGKRIKWKREDRADEMTGGLDGMVRGLAQSAGLLDERIFFDLLLGTTNILPTTVNAADGAALHSATDGASADRFGISGGNIVTGSGVASSAAVRADFWDSHERVGQFLDGKGQPLFGDAVKTSGYVVIYGVANEEVFREAFLQGRTHEASGAAVTNTILESGLSVDLWSSSRITDNDWFIFVKNPPQRSVFVQDREALEERFADAETSDYTRDTDNEYMQVRLRKSGGVVLPYDTVKVNN